MPLTTTHPGWTARWRLLAEAADRLAVTGHPDGARALRVTSHRESLDFIEARAELEPVR